MRTGIVRPALTFLAVTALVGIVPGLAACRQDDVPHVDHVTLPTHRTWRVVSVQPYEGLPEVELVKFDWPTSDDPSIAFALTKEGLSVGDPICLDHVREIDTYWAHPVPAGGCEALGARAK
jgi:hypothetical protein